MSIDADPPLAMRHTESGKMLSVIIPNFNHGHLLPTTLDALMRQILPPDEIIIIDDGSTDSSRQVIERAAAEHARIRAVLKDGNQGVIPTLNEGLALATGRYVFFAAADDWTEPALLSTAVRELEAHPTAALFCAEVQIVDQDGRPIGLRPPARPSHRTRFFAPPEVRNLLRHIDHFIVTLTAVFRREHLVAAGGFDIGLRSLADGFCARRLALMHGFVFAPACLATWRINPAGASRSDAREIGAAGELLRAAQSRIRHDPVFPAGFDRLFERRWRYATSRLALNAGDFAFIRAFGSATRLDRSTVDLLQRLPLGARPFGQIWLALRFRPFAFGQVVATAVLRLASGASRRRN